MFRKLQNKTYRIVIDVCQWFSNKAKNMTFVFGVSYKTSPFIIKYV